jgi:hypothetical protein
LCLEFVFLGINLSLTVAIVDNAIDLTKKFLWRHSREELGICSNTWDVLIKNTEFVLNFFSFGLIGAAVSCADSTVLSPGSATCSGMLSLLSGDLLLLTLDLVFLVDHILAVGKVEVNLLERGAVVLVDPGVLEDVGHLGAGGRVELQEPGDQVFEFFREIVGAVGLILGVRLPEEIGTVRADQSVEGVGGLSSSEGGVLGEHNEKNDGGSEKIDRGSHVRASGVDLRGHVALGAKLGFQITRTVATGNRSGKAEIGNFKIEILVKKKIFRF